MLKASLASACFGAARLAAACLAFAAFQAPAQTGAASAPAATGRLGGDRFVAGGSVALREPVAGDLFGAGGSVDVDAGVEGDAVLAGGRVRVGSNVGHSVFATGGHVALNAAVGRNVRAAGGQVEFGPSSRVAGNVSAAGGQVLLRGTVLGHVQAAGGRVFIDGPVSGDVIAASGQVELGPNARVKGSLRYRGGDVLRRDPAAQVQGPIQELPPWRADDSDDDERERRRFGHAGLGSVVWTAGLALLAAVWLGALPGWSTRVSETLQSRPAMSVLLGAIGFICAPFAVLLLIVTIVGIPLGLLVATLCAALLPIAYVSAAIGLGDWVLHRLHAQAAQRLGWRIGTTAAALFVLSLLAWVPWLGGMIVFAVLLAGLGAMLLQLRRRAAQGAA